jgi:muramoyltetrapeptide carboxypeptidase
MIIPPYLKKGDTVLILSTARKVSESDLSPSIPVLEGWGLKVLIGSSIGPEDHQFAGPDSLRIQDFQKGLDNPEVKAILFARGGYGSVRVLDSINWSGFLRNPKWLAGFSDATVFHCHVQAKYGIPTLHGVMPSIFRFDEKGLNAQETLRKALFGENLEYQSPQQGELLRIGNGEGIVVGGNISIIYSMLGSESDFNTDGKILFLEDLDEYLYHVDRMIISLKRSGKFRNLQGLIIGGLTDMNDNDVPFGKTSEEIIMEHVADHSYPVCFNFPAGHLRDNRALRLGMNARLSVSSKEAVLKFK